MMEEADASNRYSQYSFKPEEELDISNINSTLIDLVRKTTYLYDKSDRRYTDRYRCEKTWDDIGSKLGISGADAKTAWTRLRNNYSKVLRRRQLRVAGKMEKPWVYEEEMQFLKKHVIIKLNHRHSLPFSVLRHPSSSNDHSQSSVYENEEEMIDSDFTIEYVKDDGDEEEVSPSGQIMDDFEHNVNNDEDEGGKVGLKGKKMPIKTEIVPMSQMMLSNRSSSLGKDLAFSSAACQSQSQHKMHDGCCSRLVEAEDPLVGWFKSFVPLLKTLSPINLLEFQSKVTNELKEAVAKEQQEKKESGS